MIEPIQQWLDNSRPVERENPANFQEKVEYIQSIINKG